MSVRRSPKFVPAAMVLAVAGSIGLRGYGLWADDVCITDERALSVPEGSSGSSHFLAWPPGAIRCEWKTPRGTDMSFTAVPVLD